MGSAVAMNNTAFLYEHGLGVTQDYAEAKRWYQKAAAAGNSQAMDTSEIFIFTETVYQRTTSRPTAGTKKQPQRASSFAMNNLGNLYLNGNGVAKDYAQARGWYEKQPLRVYAGCDEQPRKSLFLRKRCTKGLRPGPQLVRKSSRCGLSFAMNNLGNLYLNGNVSAKTTREDLNPVRTAAAAGNPIGDEQYRRPLQDWILGVPKILQRRKGWYEKAAAVGNAVAMIRLGDIYRRPGALPSA